MAKDRLGGKKTLKVGGFLDEFEKDEVRKKIDIVTLFDHFGIRLTKKGKNYVGLCPWHPDTNPSLSVTKETGLYHCFSCHEAGDHFKLVEKMKGCGFKESLAYVKKLIGKVDVVPEVKPAETEKKKGPAEKTSEPVPAPEKPGMTNVSLDIVGDYYHKKLYTNKTGMTYLTETRKIKPELIKRFKIGFADKSLVDIVSNGQKEALIALNILKTTEKGRVWEFFTSCLTFPILDEAGKVVHFYGRKADPQAENPHLYLSGSHKSIFNRKASRVYDTIILVESVLDCLSLITLGFENVQPLYGVGTFTEEHISLLRNDRVKTIVLAFDNDAAGKSGTEKHKKTLLEAGFSVKVIIPPNVKDWNDYLTTGGNAESVRTLITAAQEETPEKETTAFEVIKKGQKYIFTIADITYRVLGAKIMFTTNLRVNIKAEYNDMRFPDNVDLCSARSRSTYSQTLARIFELEVRRIENDLLRIADYFDDEREKESSFDTENIEEITLTDRERKEGLSFLKSRQMFDQVTSDMTALGYVNEKNNKLIVYIAAMSRYMKKPLNVYIQSGSSGGKSALLSALEQIILPTDIWKATTISAQAFNYVEQERFLDKVFFMGESIHDEAIEGLVRQMQSEGEISRLVTVKDEKTGEMRAQLIRKKVRMSFMVTSTALHLNAENASRCLILTADESKTQTYKVQERLGINHDFAGVIMNPHESKKIINKHYAAQMQLKKVYVYNPFCKHISFPTARPSMRRAYEQYLTMIDTICFLRQMQKADEIRIDPATNEEIVCKACDLTDYETAYNLFTQGVLQNSGFDIPTGTRKLHEAIRDMVRDQAEKQNLKVNEVSFIQKQLREYTQLGGEFIKKHIRILVNYEYLEPLGGRRHGTRHAYRLREDRPIEEMDLSMITTPEELSKLIEEIEIF